MGMEREVSLFQRKKQFIWLKIASAFDQNAAQKENWEKEETFSRYAKRRKSLSKKEEKIIIWMERDVTLFHKK